MHLLQLVPVSSAWHSQLTRLRSALLDETDTIPGGSWLEKYPDLQAWQAFVERNRNPGTVDPGLVPFEQWLVCLHDGPLVGVFGLRLALNDYLAQYGGHIGYSIIPNARGHGYGTEALRLGIERARQLGMERLLVTCDAQNIASERIIQKNGGLLENTVRRPDGVEVRRYWIAC